MNLFGIQLDLFGNAPKEPEKPKVPSSVSQNGLVHFKYNSQLKKSIRCKGGVLFGHPEVILPAYMKDPEFAQARELAAEWAEHAIRRKTAKNKAVIKDLVKLGTSSERAGDSFMARNRFRVRDDFRL